MRKPSNKDEVFEDFRAQIVCSTDAKILLHGTGPEMHVLARKPHVSVSVTPGPCM